MTVLLVHELWMVRESLKRILPTTLDCKEVLQTSTLDEARNLAKDYEEIELAIIDPCVENASWLQDLSLLVEHTRLFRVIIIAEPLRREDILPTLEMGVMGYLRKNATPDEIVTAVKRVMDGDIYLTADYMQPRDNGGDSSGMLDSALINDWSKQVYLTHREFDVLKCLAEGKTNREISTELGVSTHTVRSYVSFLMKKLKLADRTQVALSAPEVISRVTTERR